jgi:glycosyltransferase involved in cell wall biosynthesis
VVKNALSVDVIVPVTLINGKEENLRSWIQNDIPANFKIHVIHDIQDSESGTMIGNMLHEKKHPNIFYYEGYYGSPGKTRNSVLHAIAGDWVCYWDADDLPIVEEVERMIIGAEKQKADIAIGKFAIHKFGSSRPLSTETNLPLQDDEIALSPGIWRMAFRRSNISSIRFNESLMGEDQVYLCDIDFANMEWYRHKEIVYRYFVGIPNQLTAEARNCNGINVNFRTVHARLSKENSRRAIRIYAIMLTRIYLTMIVKDRTSKKIIPTFLFLFIMLRTPRRFIIGFIPSVKIGFDTLMGFVVKNLKTSFLKLPGIQQKRV